MSTNKKVPHGRLKQGFDSPVQPTMRNLSKNIRKTEADLVKLRKENGNRFYQSGDGAHLSQVRRGQIQFSPDGTSLVTLFKEADSSTFVHEMGHLLLRDLLADALIAGVKQNGGFYILNAPGMRDGSDWASVVKKREHRRGKLVFPLFYYIMNKVNFLHHKACNISVVDKSSHIRYSTLGGAFLKSEVACLWAALQVTSERRIMPALLARCVLQESRSSPCGTLRAIFRDNLLKFF